MYNLKELKENTLTVLGCTASVTELQTLFHFKIRMLVDPLFKQRGWLLSSLRV